MRIAIISDTHDNLPNFKKAMEWIKKQGIETVIHCGDACAPATLKEVLKDFSGKMHFVFGNACPVRSWLENCNFKKDSTIKKKYFSRDILKTSNGVHGDLFRITKLSYENLPNLKLCGEMGELEIDPVRDSGGKEKIKSQQISNEVEGKKIAFCHFPEFAKGLAHTQKYDLVFYGHNHKPWEEKVRECRLVNPGNLSGWPYKATFAIYDTKTDKLTLKILEKL